jgi:hypothetical protein
VKDQIPDTLDSTDLPNLEHLYKGRLLIDHRYSLPKLAIALTSAVVEPPPRDRIRPLVTIVRLVLQEEMHHRFMLAFDRLIQCRTVKNICFTLISPCTLVAAAPSPRALSPPPCVQRCPSILIIRVNVRLVLQ